MSAATFTLDDLMALLVQYADLPPGMAVDDPATALVDLDVDSAGLLALQQALQDTYGITIRQSDAAQLATLGSAVEYVNGLLAARASG